MHFLWRVSCNTGRMLPPTCPAPWRCRATLRMAAQACNPAVCSRAGCPDASRDWCSRCPSPAPAWANIASLLCSQTRVLPMASPRVLHIYTPSPQVPRCRSPPRCALDRSCWQRNRPRHCDLATVSRLDARARIVRTAHPQCTPHIAAVVLLRRSRAARIRTTCSADLRCSFPCFCAALLMCLHRTSSRKRHQDRHQEQGHAAARAVRPRGVGIVFRRGGAPAGRAAGAQTPQ